MSWSHGLAEWLARHAGDDARAAELHDYLAHARAHGELLSPADAGSIAVLVGRRVVSRVVLDLPWLAVAALLTLPYLLLLGHSYETHFFAWDMANGETPVSASARSWRTIVDWLTVVGLLGAFIASRRAIEHLRRGRSVGPLLLALAWFVAASQSDLFIERTPWFRDGRLRAEHIDIVPFYSVGLYAAFVLIPLCFLMWDLVSRRRRAGRSRIVSIERDLIDPKAVAAAGSIFLIVFQPLLAPFAMLGFLWAARPFSRTLKIVATVAVLAPINTFIGYALVTDIDDPPSVVLGMMLVTVAVWLRVAFVALRPSERRAPATT